MEKKNHLYKRFNDDEKMEYINDFLMYNQNESMTIRQYCEMKGFNKSTFGFWLNKWLEKENIKLYKEYKVIALRNKKIGVIKGGKNSKGGGRKSK